MLGMEDDGEEGHDAVGRLYQDEHPMLNPLVVEKVLEFSKPDVETLKNIRLVCKMWHSLTYDLWRKTATLKLVDDEGLFRRKVMGGLPLSQFMTRFEDQDDPFEFASRPFTRYKTVDLTIDISLAEEEGPCKRFWNGVGPLVEYFHLERCSFPKIPRLQFDKMLFEMLPNLQHLSITDTELTNLKTSLMPPKSTIRQMRDGRKKLREQRHLNLRKLEIYGDIPRNHPFKIICRLPKLECLKLRNGVKRNYGDTISLLDGMSKLSANSTGWKLKELDLMHTNGFSRWFSLPRILSEWKLPLEVLSMEIRPDQSSTEPPLQPFLQHHSNTLRVLNAFCAPLANHAMIISDNFPYELTQDKLEELYLDGNVTKNFRFLKFMPSLKKVCIQRNCVDRWMGIKAAISRWNSGVLYRGGGRRNRVTIQPFEENMVQNALILCDMSLVMMPDLVHLHVDYEFGWEYITKLTEWMPNLKILKTILKNSTLPLVCEKWPTLEELVCLYGSDIDDNGITGWNQNEKDGLPTKDESIPASIVDLEYLKVFELNVLCDKGQLNDWSAEYGFLKMKRLETLKIGVSSKFTMEAEQSLANHIPNVQIIRNSGPGPHPDYGCCTMRKFLSQINKLQPIRVSNDEDTDEWDSLESDLDLDVVSLSDNEEEDDDDDDDANDDLDDDISSSENVSDDDNVWLGLDSDGADDDDEYYDEDLYGDDDSLEDDPYHLNSD